MTIFMCREPIFRLSSATAINLAIAVNIKNAIQSEKVHEIFDFLALVVVRGDNPISATKFIGIEPY
jgi:hypothetical protein